MFKICEWGGMYLLEYVKIGHISFKRYGNMSCFKFSVQNYFILGGNADEKES